MRVRAGAWRTLTDEGLLEAYRGIEAKLQGRGLSRAVVESCLNYLFHFVCLATGDQSPDVRRLSGAHEDMDRALAAWQTMQDEGHWNQRHRQRVRTQLSWALSHVAESLAQAVNPMRRAAVSRGEPVVNFVAERSQDRIFELHACLPARLRQAPALHVEYRLIHRLLDEMSSHLRSVSKAHLQRIGLFLDALLHGNDTIGPMWPTTHHEAGNDVPSRWAWLRHCSPRQWLRRFGDVFRGAQRTMTFEHFKRHVRYLHLLHGKVLNGGQAKVGIPLPSASGRLYCSEALEGLSTASCSLGSSAASSDVDVIQQEERRTLREMLAQLQAELCVVTDRVVESQRVYAFEPGEVRAILEAAVGPLERLVVVVFFVTGLRIGGLSRIQVPSSIQTTGRIAPTDVPEILSTVEKNGKVRKIRLNDTCRVLVARWYERGRPVGTSRFLFPGGVTTGDHPVATRTLWQVCHRVFVRGGVSGRHVHPHTFRHTVIQMLYMRGMSFDAIAKWIGHSNPSITSGIYGRLSQDNLNGLMRGVPFVDEGTVDDVKARWKSLAEYIARPYVFEEHETVGLKKRPATGDDARHDHAGRRRAAQQAALHAGITGDLAENLQDLVQQMVAKELAKKKVP